MKNSIFIFLALCLSISLNAQNEKYIKAMETNVAKLDMPPNEVGMQPLANAFERIASAEKDEWLPNYYHAYANVQLALAAMQKQETDKIEPLLDKAQASLDKAKALKHDECEVLTLQGYIYMGRIWPNPMVYGAMYGPKAGAEWEKAIKANPNNPRPYSLQAQNTYFTPEFFGGGAEAALPYFQKAAEQFESFKPESSIHPNWGIGANQYFLKEIEKKAAGN